MNPAAPPAGAAPRLLPPPRDHESAAMALFGTLPVVRAQLAPSPAFTLALDYVTRCLEPGSPESDRIAAVPEGETVRIELGGGVFAL